MQSRPRILSSLLAAFLLVGVTSQAASCTLDTDGLTNSVPREACNEDATCNDKDQCTVNLCGANKTCEFKPVSGLAPEQKAGDCQQGNCTDGKLAQNTDDTDLPDDLESCTKDSCANGSPVHDVLPDGSLCLFGDSAGLCKAGKCTIECGPQKPCNDGNFCTEDTCNASTGVCSFAVLDGLPTPGFIPVVGDCSQQICVNGVNTKIADDADLPNDDNICTNDGCDNGMPEQMPANANAPCMTATGTGVCNMTGVCLQCNAPEDCPAIVPANPCKQRTCTNNACGVMDLVNVDVTSKVGDCKKTSCSATAMPLEQNDDLDVPNDNNPCTKNLCTNGMPSHPPEASGFSCGGALTCDGAGQCACNVVADCGLSDECKSYTCTGGKCQIMYTAPSTPVSGQMIGDCQVQACDGAGNIASVVDTTDLPNDNLECTADSCTADGTAVNELVPLDTACAQNGGTVCNGLGACLVAQGGACQDAMACITGFCTDGVCCADTCTGECKACNIPMNVGTCTNIMATFDDVPLCTGTNSCDGMGACKRDNGQPCGMNAECSSGFCADGVCCTSACDETCKSCNVAGNVGTCTLIALYSTDPTGASPCNNPKQCDGQGACKSVNGVTCTQPNECLSGSCADGYCCGNACTQLCMACSNALTGFSNGACRPILNGTDPASECPGNNDCNGFGGCTGLPGLQPNGSACSAAGQCFSTFCIDGVCCNAACTESCKTCNKMGSVGTCSTLIDAFDTTSTPPCTAPNACDSAGVCKGLNGAPCMTGNQCVSNNCVDGFCCNNICNTTCRSCSAALNGGNNGTCGPTKVGTDPDNECAANCDGAGMCAP